MTLPQMIQFLLVSILATAGYCQTPVPPSERVPDAKPPANLLTKLLEDKNGEMAKLAESVLGKNGGDKLFYCPSKGLPFTPEKFDLKFEEVAFKSADGTQLHGWFLPSASAELRPLPLSG